MWGALGVLEGFWGALGAWCEILGRPGEMGCLGGGGRVPWGSCGGFRGALGSPQPPPRGSTPCRFRRVPSKFWGPPRPPHFSPPSWRRSWSGAGSWSCGRCPRRWGDSCRPRVGGTGGRPPRTPRPPPEPPPGTPPCCEGGRRGAQLPQLAPPANLRVLGDLGGPFETWGGLLGSPGVTLGHPPNLEEGGSCASWGGP